MQWDRKIFNENEQNPQLNSNLKHETFAKRKFSLQEENAVVEGVRKHGVGNWVARNIIIKSLFLFNQI